MTEIKGLPMDWLGDVTTLSILESRASKAEADGLPASVVTHLRETIRWLAAELRDDDIIRWFNSGDETWQRMCGVSGLAIIRNGIVHRALMLAMN